MFFNWLKRLFGRGQYSKRERALFSYFDGKEHRKVDPMPLYRAVTAAWPILEIQFQLLSSPFTADGEHFPEATQDALPTVAAKVRDIFSIPAYDDKTGTGKTELELLELLYDFLTYTGGVKKNTKPKAISTAATTDSTVLPTVESPATNVISDSGSTETVPSTVPPIPSPSDPE